MTTLSVYGRTHTQKFEQEADFETEMLKAVEADLAGIYDPDVHTDVDLDLEQEAIGQPAHTTETEIVATGGVEGPVGSSVIGGSMLAGGHGLLGVEDGVGTGASVAAMAGGPIASAPVVVGDAAVGGVSLGAESSHSHAEDVSALTGDGLQHELNTQRSHPAGLHAAMLSPSDGEIGIRGTGHSKDQDQSLIEEAIMAVELVPGPESRVGVGGSASAAGDHEDLSIRTSTAGEVSQ